MSIRRNLRCSRTLSDSSMKRWPIKMPCRHFMNIIPSRNLFGEPPLNNVSTANRNSIVTSDTVVMLLCSSWIPDHFVMLSFPRSWTRLIRNRSWSSLFQLLIPRGLCLAVPNSAGSERICWMPREERLPGSSLWCPNRFRISDRLMPKTASKVMLSNGPDS